MDESLIQPQISTAAATAATPSSFNEIPNPNPKSNLIDNPTRILRQTINPASFKTKKKKNRKKKKPKKPVSDPPPPTPNSCNELPCEIPIDETPPVWLTWTPNLATPTQPVTESEKLVAARLQHKVMNACSKFFAKRACSDSDGEDEDGYEEIEYFEFFMGLFEEGSEIRSYYEQNYEGGEFCCLVCGALRNKVWRRFKHCAGVVQHSFGTSKRKMKRAHTAFGRVICEVIGWDVGRLPVNDQIMKNADGNKDDFDVLKDNVEALNCRNGQSDLKGNYNVDKDNVETSNCNDGVSASKGDCNVIQNSGEPVLHENTLKEDDGNKDKESFGKGILDVGEIKGAVDCLISGIDQTYEKPVNESSVSTLNQPTLKPHSIPMIPLDPAEVLENIAADLLQLKVVKACQEFFAQNDSDADELMNEDDVEQCKEFKFFLKVFSEEDELRRYYENKFEGGQFCCLACSRTWKNGKRFKGCITLIQHSTSIAKATKNRAHRVYVRVICKVLGWDFNRLPSIVPLGEPLSSSLAKPGSQVITASDKDDPSVIGNSHVHLKNDDMMICEACNFYMQ